MPIPLDEVFLAFTLAAFLQFVLFFLVEMRYLLRIWLVSRPTPRDSDALRRELGTLLTTFCAFLLPQRWTPPPRTSG